MSLNEFLEGDPAKFILKYLSFNYLADIEFKCYNSRAVIELLS